MAKERYAEGEDLLQQKDYIGASLKFEEALQYRPRYLEALLSLGVSYLRLRRVQDAQRQFSQALELNPEYAPTHYNIATCHALRGDKDKALAELAMAISLSPKCRDWAQRDSDFKTLREVPAFQQMMR